jgi:hypothetical protein
MSLWKFWLRRFQQESTDEQEFTTVSSIIAPLKPIAEGVQSKFVGWFGQHLFCFQESELSCRSSDSDQFSLHLFFIWRTVCGRVLYSYCVTVFLWDDESSGNGWVVQGTRSRGCQWLGGTTYHGRQSAWSCSWHAVQDHQIEFAGSSKGMV